MIKKLIVAGLILLSTVALSDQVILGWDTPTQNVDKTELRIEDIKGYVIDLYLDGVRQPEISIDINTHIDFQLEAIAGDYLFRMATVNVDGITGPFSDMVPFTVRDIQDAPPEAPKLNITIQCAPEGCTMEIK